TTATPSAAPIVRTNSVTADGAVLLPAFWFFLPLCSFLPWCELGGSLQWRWRPPWWLVRRASTLKWALVGSGATGSVGKVTLWPQAVVQTTLDRRDDAPLTCGPCACGCHAPSRRPPYPWHGGKVTFGSP